MILQRCTRQLLKSILLVTTLLTNNTILAATEQEQAIQIPVQELHTALVSIMQSADTKNFQERYDIIQPVIVEHFNSALIAKVILSRYWKTLDKEAQKNFIDSFNRLTISTYVDRFDSYNEETFKELSIEKMKKNRFMVKTEYVRKNDEPVSFNYIVQNNNDKWKIISVIANGINDLSLKRADYAAIIKGQGFDALMTNLEQKISDLQP